MEFIEVEIKGWEKYNPRRDYQKPWWFALSNTITEDDDFSEFTDAEFKAWIHILCTASVQKTNRPRLFFKAIERKTGIKQRTLLSSIGKLEILKLIQTPARICTDPVRDLCSTLQEQDKNKTIQNSNAHAEAFALFWDGYPNKKGKTEAEKKYRAAIKAGASHEAISLARDKYRDQLARDGTDKKFILHGSTFMGRYKEFLDPDYGSAELFAAPLTDAEAKERALFDGEGA